MKGLIHIYTGDGKGKTTAALGLAIRAAGAGIRVVILQFLKGSETAELSSLSKIPGVTVIRNSRDFGFYKTMSEEDRAAVTGMHNLNLQKALSLVEKGECGLLILDEVMAAYNHDLLDRGLVEKLVCGKPEDLELVLTGRGPCPLFLEKADYVTEMKKVKHPFDRGISARKGIEV